MSKDDKMKISKSLIVDKEIKFLKHKLNRIKTNKSVNNVYLVCTGTRPGYLFEIIEGKYRLASYKDASLVGLATTKEEAIVCVQALVDALYNTNQTTYDKLKT